MARFSISFPLSGKPPKRLNQLALARLEARVGFVDHVNAALAAHDPAILIAQFSRLKGVSYLHNLYPCFYPFRVRKARKIGGEKRSVNGRKAVFLVSSQLAT